jgi:hypothetical protein
MRQNFFIRVMQMIEWSMAILFLPMAYQLAVNHRWLQALGVMIAVVLLTSRIKPQIKLSVMLIVIIMLEITLEN